MKNLIAILALLIVLYACGKEDSRIVEPKVQVETAADFYPGGVGSSFVYKIERVDTLLNTSDSLGINYSSIDSVTTYNGVRYFVENSSLALNGSSLPMKILFRRSDAGVYFTIDTTGFDMLLPDSILQNVEITSDPEAIVFSYPLFDGKDWTAYKLNLTIGAFDLSLVDVHAYYLGKETLLLPAAGSIDAEKIKYVATLIIPNPDNFIEYTESTFTINGWFAKNIGLVKAEGNAEAVNAILGIDAFTNDSVSVIRQTILSYEIK